MDSTSEEEFEEKYTEFKRVWLEREGKESIDYIERHKKETFKRNRADIRTPCGLGDPPVDYDQNGNEATNSVIKRAKEHPGKMSIKALIRLFQKEILNQEEKVKSTLVGRGE